MFLIGDIDDNSKIIKFINHTVFEIKTQIDVIFVFL